MFRWSIEPSVPFKLACFNHYVKRNLITESVNSFIRGQDAEYLAMVGKDYRFSAAEEVQAFTYAVILSKFDLLNMTEARKKFGGMGPRFWRSILSLHFVPEELISFWHENQEHCLREEVWKNFKDLGTDLSFAQLLVKLTPEISGQELEELYLLTMRPNFMLLSQLLPNNANISFQTLKHSSAIYLDNESKHYKKILKDTLTGVPVDKWRDFAGVIESFQQQDEEADNLVEEALQLALSTIKDGKFLSLSSISERVEQVFTNVRSSLHFARIHWQLQIASVLVRVHQVLQCRYAFVTLGTGHGKSLIIQLVAQSLATIHHAKVFVVCLNGYLASQATCTFRNCSPLVEYIPIDKFLQLDPQPNCTVIYDEIDQMLGGNSFHFEKLSSKYCRPLYRPSLMNQWKGVIALSGTTTSELLKHFKTDFPDAFIALIPQLRVNKCENILTDVIKVDQSLEISLIKFISVKREQVENFVIIFEDGDQLAKARAKFPSNLFQDRKICVFNNFKQNHYQVFMELEVLKDGRFVVLTTKEGSRGVDYRGKSPAHVVICYDPDSSAELVQALGRGSRTLDAVATGSIVCKEPIDLNPGRYLKTLEIRDAERMQGQEKSFELCSFFHQKEVSGSQNVGLLKQFKKFLESGKSFENAQHDPNMTLYKGLTALKEEMMQNLAEEDDWAQPEMQMLNNTEIIEAMSESK